MHEHLVEGSSDEDIDLSPRDKSNTDASPKNTSIIHNASKMLSQANNPKYLLKLGFMKNELTWDVDEIDEVESIIDDLINKIKFDWNPTMFFNDYEQAKHELQDLNIKHDLNINSMSSQGWTCLHAACQYGNQQLVQFLLSTMKCNPNILSNDGWAALHIASHLGFYEIVNILLKDKRTRPELIGNEERGTGLHCAVKAGYFKVVQMYLMNNASMNIKNADGQTPKDIWKDPNILSLFEKFESWEPEKQDKDEEIKEEVELEDQSDNEESKQSKENGTSEITYKYDLDRDSQSSPKKSETEDKLHQNSESLVDSRDSLILESQMNPYKLEKESYLDRVLNILEDFKNNVKTCGYITRVGKYYLSSKNRYFEVNPVQGTFIKYKNYNDYPHKPRQIFKLDEISDIMIINDGWFFK